MRSRLVVASDLARGRVALAELVHRRGLERASEVLMEWTSLTL
jgi:hypothetical protein